MKLHLGSGLNILTGWTNTDVEIGDDAVMFLDFTKKFPFEDESFDAVFSEHAIEHVQKSEGHFMLSEAFRVLKPGGSCRIVTPCLENMAKLIFYPDGPVATRYVEWFKKFVDDDSSTIYDAFNKMFYGHGHRHIYSKHELFNVLSTVGFVNLEYFDTGVYGNSVFSGVDSHGKWIGDDIARIESVAIECRKPE
ncbi:methyltransferase domain-containing protein [Agrobacterium sp. O3.4]|uniref:Methyltransferase domain-containing protein n=2 Tax=Rhizobium/Agrobacterium group TaxID=227290 RepID=A0A546XIG1_RHIRH|nr:MULTISPECIES: methyltransferase domain-containing protein [Rhizobium/Agrobacterium group]MCZ7468500.1 methyltransferase domain-containing protein [Rhizobium rhizogenes]TRB00478.1 methyltransferase domain-containing protein [Rhizobium rhizogenes]WHO08377.1 methyltransferase domain-containing protein [Agrobacterium cucumeris]